MKQKRFFLILRLLHFSDNRNEPDETDKNYDRLWETRTIFGKVNTKHKWFRIKIYMLCYSKGYT
jgi:hypothetical protein